MKKIKVVLVQVTENFFRYGVWIFLVIFLFFVATLISAENYETQTENKISYSSVYDQKTNQYYLKLNYFSEDQIEKITTKNTKKHEIVELGITSCSSCLCGK